MKIRLISIALVAAVGLIDATYLTVQHYVNKIPPCTIHGCETVLTSKYATIGSIPVALLGVGYYLMVVALSIFLMTKGLAMWRWLVVIVSMAMVATLGFVYLQGFVIHAWCQYCLLSAAATTTLFILVVSTRPRKRLA